MRMPEGQDLLDLADATRGRGSAHRAIALLAACDPALTAASAAALDVAALDDRLLDLCEAHFGDSLAARARCPACGTALDMQIETRALRQTPMPAAGTVLEVAPEGVPVAFRLPRGGDLLAIEPHADPAAARRDLLARCVLEGEGIGLSEAVLDAMAAAMAAAAPQADVTLAVTCNACGHDWEALLDIGTYLWRDLDWRAERLCQDVHVLASTYHWSEADILALPPARRRRYLALVES